jgi:hypothetical protein
MNNLLIVSAPRSCIPPSPPSEPSSPLISSHCLLQLLLRVAGIQHASSRSGGASRHVPSPVEASNSWRNRLSFTSKLEAPTYQTGRS